MNDNPSLDEETRTYEGPVEYSSTVVLDADVEWNDELIQAFISGVSLDDTPEQDND